MAGLSRRLFPIPYHHLDVLAAMLIPENENDPRTPDTDTLSSSVISSVTPVNETSLTESVDSSQGITGEINQAEGHQCRNCGKFLGSKSDFHFDCSTCGESFLINQLLKEHTARNHKKTGVAKCKVCGKVLGSYRGMREHVKEHPNVNHACSECDKSFNTKAKLNRHLSVHNKEFSCGTCTKSFGSKICMLCVPIFLNMEGKCTATRQDKAQH